MTPQDIDLVEKLDQKFSSFHKTTLTGQKRYCWHLFSRDNYGADETLAVYLRVKDNPEWIAIVEHDSGYGAEDIITTKREAIESIADLLYGTKPAKISKPTKTNPVSFETRTSNNEPKTDF